MPIGPIVERSLLIYLVTLYFVILGFLESIKRMRGIMWVLPSWLTPVRTPRKTIDSHRRFIERASWPTRLERTSTASAELFPRTEVSAR